MEVLAHERTLLETAGHLVEEYTLPATEDLGLSGMRAAVKAVWNRDACARVDDLIMRTAPDVVHVHTPFPLMSPAVFRTAHLREIPTVTTLHSYRWSCIVGTCFRDGAVCEECVGSRVKLPGVIHRCYHDSVAASAALTFSLALHNAVGTRDRCVDRWLVLTAFAKKLLIRDGVAPDKIEVKPNSVPDCGVGPGPTGGERTVLFAGRLLDIKGVGTLLESWGRISRAGVRLVIAGDGAMRPRVESLAATDGSVKYAGWVSEADVTRMMGRAELVVVPSEWYEGGLPLTVLRSLSVGTPVLISDLESFADAVTADGVGYTFRAGDVESLATALDNIIRNPQGTKSKRPLARRSYERHYSPGANLHRLERIYAEVIMSSRHDRSEGLPGPRLNGSVLREDAGDT